jgi:hypothetical protein
MTFAIGILLIFVMIASLVFFCLFVTIRDHRRFMSEFYLEAERCTTASTRLSTRDLANPRSVT